MTNSFKCPLHGKLIKLIKDNIRKTELFRLSTFGQISNNYYQNELPKYYLIGPAKHAIAGRKYILLLKRVV